MNQTEWCLGGSCIRFSTDLTEAPVINDTDAGSITAKNPLGKIIFILACGGIRGGGHRVKTNPATMAVKALV